MLWSWGSCLPWRWQFHWRKQGSQVKKLPKISFPLMRLLGMLSHLYRTCSSWISNMKHWWIILDIASGENLEVQYLGENDVIPTYPVTGLLFNPNGRLMVNLLYKESRTSVQHRLCNRHWKPCNMQALIAVPGSNTPKYLSLNIHHHDMMVL